MTTILLPHQAQEIINSGWKDSDLSNKVLHKIEFATVRINTVKNLT